MAVDRGGLPRIAVVAHDVHDHGGMERVTADLIRGLHGDHHLVVVAADVAPELRPLVEWRRVRVPRRPFLAKFVAFYLGAAGRCAEVDLVHTVGAIVPNRADIATVHFCHAGFRDAGGSLAPPDASPGQRLGIGAARAVALLAERWSYRAARLRLVAAVSDGVAEEVRRHYPNVKVEVTPNGVDADRFRPDPAGRMDRRRAAGLDDDDVVALFVGGDWHRKGLAIALEAVARARRTGATTLRLWVVGTGNRRHYESLARNLGIADVVRFHGAVERTEDHYRAADIFLLPTLYEAFSLVTLEAAASGLPILVSQGVSGVAELLGDAGAGFVLPRRAETFAAALAELAGDRERRIEMGRRARERARLFPSTDPPERIRELYRSLLAENGHR